MLNLVVRKETARLWKVNIRLPGKNFEASKGKIICTKTNISGNVYIKQNRSFFVWSLLLLKSSQYYIFVQNELKCLPKALCFCECNFIRYPACNACVPYSHLWPFRLYSLLLPYQINGKILEKNLMSIKCVLGLYLQSLSQIFCIKKNWTRCGQKVI